LCSVLYFSLVWLTAFHDMTTSPSRLCMFQPHTTCVFWCCFIQLRFTKKCCSVCRPV
jgi:hypothetical protein